MDLDKISRSGLVTKWVSVDVPRWMVDKLDWKAKELGITRQSIIKHWLAEHLDEPIRARLRRPYKG